MIIAGNVILGKEVVEAREDAPGGIIALATTWE